MICSVNNPIHENQPDWGHFPENGNCVYLLGIEDSTLRSQQFLDDCNDKYEIPFETASRIQICADEIVSNIVKYSHAKTIGIYYKLENNEVVLEFEDDGMLYDPMKSAEPDIALSPAKRSIGGLGLFMVKKIASSVEYTEKDGRNNIRIVFQRQ